MIIINDLMVPFLRLQLCLFNNLAIRIFDEENRSMLNGVGQWFLNLLSLPLTLKKKFDRRLLQKKKVLVQKYVIKNLLIFYKK